MGFLYPNFLWALFAILIPVIIHLFYFKRFKKVYFSNTKFLKEIKEETTNKNKIKNLLVLLSRILAIVFLVLAFAQPYFPIGHKLKKGSKGVSRKRVWNCCSNKHNGRLSPKVGIYPTEAKEKSL
jgi:Na+/H+ antiporter NhaD/arsenite permease-like protein